MLLLFSLFFGLYSGKGFLMFFGFLGCFFTLFDDVFVALL